MITSKISRLALVSGFAILGTVALTPKAQAQTANVDFEGNNPATCSVTPTAGTLAVATSKKLSTQASGGVNGKLTVTCNAGTKFKITSIDNNGSTGFTYANLKWIAAFIMDGATQVIESDVSPNGSVSIVGPLNVDSPLQSGPLNAKEYSVVLNVDNLTGADLPIGTYKIRVGVALTPQ